LGYTKSTFSHWDDDTVPRHSTLLKIADYFGVTVDELLREAPKEEGEHPTSVGESPEKDKLSFLLETLSPEQLRQVADYVDFIVSRRK
jgi:transcriptional regulator with XRE-family HTH domain